MLSNEILRFLSKIEIDFTVTSNDTLFIFIVGFLRSLGSPVNRKVFNCRILVRKYTEGVDVQRRQADYHWIPALIAAFFLRRFIVFKLFKCYPASFLCANWVSCAYR